MEALTPAERRGALVVVLLLAIGAVRDLWRVAAPPPDAPAERVAVTAPADAPGFAGSTAAPPAAATPGPGSLDLNRATARELDALPGIGPVLAARIVEHRSRHGPFGSVEELLAVRGIGPRLFARLRARVAAGPPASPGPARADSAAVMR